MLELQQETTWLPTVVITVGVIKEINLFRALQLPVEMIGVNRLFLSVVGQTAFSPDVVGDEAVVGLPRGQDALVYTNHVERLEIEVARFEQSHELQAGSGASIELDART